MCCRTLRDLFARPEEDAKGVAARAALVDHPAVQELIAVDAPWSGYRPPQRHRPSDLRAERPGRLQTGSGRKGDLVDPAVGVALAKRSKTGGAVEAGEQSLRVSAPARRKRWRLR
jgi:hypothetical protein